MAKSSAVAAIGPSRRKRTRAGGAGRCMSGISNSAFEAISLRPGETSALPFPSLTVAVRPVTCAVTSASLISGNPSTGRMVPPVIATSTARPSSAIGGPFAGSVDNGTLSATSMRSTEPANTCCMIQERTRGATKLGHSRLSADTLICVPANPSES